MPSLELNQRLYTRDGRKYGNSRVVDVSHSSHGTYYLIQEDDGHHHEMTKTKILKDFYLEKNNNRKEYHEKDK